MGLFVGLGWDSFVVGGLGGVILFFNVIFLPPPLFPPLILKK